MVSSATWRAATGRHLLRRRLASGNVLGLLASNVLIMRAPTADGVPAILRLPAPLAQNAWHWLPIQVHVVPAPPGGRRQEPAQESGLDQQLQKLITSQLKR